ncbi:MAG TPA: glycosyltransferase family 9 protein [Candidatus Sulfotelmatobacter sp.]|nr:glycosyltransferase family 9 protein [Candidatus Sulfotelmatobacter sp.]
MGALRPKLLIIEVWNLGDLAIATPFLRAASERFDVTLLAKPFAFDLQRRFWPQIKIVPFIAPWTAFEKKYNFWNWPVRELIRLRRSLAEEKFDIGLSAHRVLAVAGGDPRDHFLLKAVGARERIGFANIGSPLLLTRSLPRPAPESHSYDIWRAVGQAIGIELPAIDQLPLPSPRREKMVMIHTGARHPVRVWPLENYRRLAGKLRALGFEVQIVCNPEQVNWWRQNGETSVESPPTVTKLIEVTDRAGAFIGNDSGPGHIAALCGVPTFTIFGPQLPEWFVPFHPHAEYIEGKACPYKPCSDYCRFPKPFCINDLSDETVWRRVEQFVLKQLPQELALHH